MKTILYEMKNGSSQYTAKTETLSDVFTDFLVASDDDEAGENERSNLGACIIRFFPVSCHYKIIAVKDIL